MRTCGIGSAQAKTTSTWSTLATSMSSFQTPRGPGWRRLNFELRGSTRSMAALPVGEQRDLHAIADDRQVSRLAVALEEAAQLALDHAAVIGQD